LPHLKNRSGARHRRYPLTTKNETAPQVLAYRHTGRRSDSETDEDRNRPHVESDRRWAISDLCLHREPMTTCIFPRGSFMRPSTVSNCFLWNAIMLKCSLQFSQIYITIFSNSPQRHNKKMIYARRKGKNRRWGGARHRRYPLTTKNETAPQVLAYRHTGRRSDSETDEDRNRPHVESDRRWANLPMPEPDKSKGEEKKTRKSCVCHFL